jgi:ribosomal protein S18 acetylase RimI-like enzyme
VGRALIDDVVTVTRDGPSARIEVTANTNALAFYEGTGFVLDHPADTELVPGLRMHLDVEH